MLLKAQLALRVLNMVDEQTGRDRLKNKVVEWLEQKNLGWSTAYVDSYGLKYIELLPEILWYLDGHTKSLEGRSLAIPSLFADFSGFNKPEQHSHKSTPMEATKLRTYSSNLFSISSSSSIVAEMFDPVCIHCGNLDDIVTGEVAVDILPTCRLRFGCFQAMPKVFKRKLNLLQRIVYSGQ